MGVQESITVIYKYTDAVTNQVHIKCHLAWKKKILEDWTKANTVQIYNEKWDKQECGNYSGISLLILPGNMYGKTLIERVQKIKKEQN